MIYCVQHELHKWKRMERDIGKCYGNGTTTDNGTKCPSKRVRCFGHWALNQNYFPLQSVHALKSLACTYENDDRFHSLRRQGNRLKWPHPAITHYALVMLNSHYAEFLHHFVFWSRSQHPQYHVPTWVYRAFL